jgi:hypothetical protein
VVGGRLLSRGSGSVALSPIAHCSNVPRFAVIYEIGVVDGVLAPVVVHAMKARDKFLR